MLVRFAVLAVIAGSAVSAARAQCRDWSSNFGAPTAGKGLNARAYDLARWNDGSGEKLYAGGDFSAAGSASGLGGIAAWNGTAWSACGSGMNGSIFCLWAQPATTATLGAPALYAGGAFTTASGSVAAHVARWNGSGWAPLGTLASNGTNGNVFALCVFDDGSGPELYAAGQFSAVSDASGTTVVNNIAKWNGTSWSALVDATNAIDGTAGGGIPGRIDALCEYDDGFGPQLYVGGWFASAGGWPAELVAKWDGNNWSRLGATNTLLAGSNVYDINVFDLDGCNTHFDEELFLGGNFATATNNGMTGWPMNHVARWSPTFQIFQSVGAPANPGFNNVVRDLHAFDDGLGYGRALFATGHFSMAGSVPTAGIARLGASAWASLGTGLNASAISLCMADFDDGASGGPDLYAGGIWTQAGPFNSNYIGEWRCCKGAQYPIAAGELVMTAQAADPCHYVVSVIDVRPPYPAPDVNWNAPQFHNEFAPTAPTEVWNATNLGQVFGVCFDTKAPPNIYVAAASIYGAAPGGPSGDGAVYKLDRLNGDISTFAVLPNTGPGLGDVCYDRFHDQFFVSNFEDGKIYRLNGAGVVLDTFDPFAADTGAAGFAPMGERVWALQIFNNRDLYFSAWLRDHTNSCEPWPAAWPPQGPNPVNNAVFRLTINGTNGAFVGNVVLVAVQSAWLTGSCDYSEPCSDIAYSPDNKRMLLGERDMFFDMFPFAHNARVLEYIGGGPGNGYLAWTTLGTNSYFVGEIPPNANCAGGADYECGNAVVATGDALHVSSDLIYGVQRIPPGGNTGGAGATATSLLVDHDGITDAGYKTLIGDLEAYRPVCAWDWYDYCTAKVNSLGCTPAIGASGDPNRASPEAFVVSCSDVLNQKSGLLFYGFNGPKSAPFQGGTMCVQAPIARTPITNSGGNVGTNDCSGAFSIDMKAFALGLLGGNPQPALAQPGTYVNCQWWSRDAGFAPPNNTSLSNALEYFIEP